MRWLNPLLGAGLAVAGSKVPVADTASIAKLCLPPVNSELSVFRVRLWFVK